ncbi:hypothetical protein NRY95_21900 [Xanthomonas campestris pv. phormiicola]|nr:hypothetical protein NRY95_21900 [Xanthomonas campestris pv. phormiicola]
MFKWQGINGTSISVFVLFISFFIMSFAKAQQPISTMPVSGPGNCNSVAFHQLPTNRSYFLGRRIINTTSDPCSGTNMTLSLFQMDWNTHTLSYVRDIISLPMTLPYQSGVVQSAYDPTVVSYNGALWVAFECAGSGTALAGVAACIAPISSTDYSVDTARVVAAVVGINLSSTSDAYSASVPKIFVYGNTPYLYWSVVHSASGPNGVIWKDITTRGAMLKQEASGLGRLWVSGSTGAAASTIDNMLTTEVLGVDASNPLSNNMADSYDVKVINGKVLLNAGIGGKGCINGDSPAYACSRLEIRSSSTPLGTDIFNSSFLVNTPLPFNPQGYSKIVTDPSGNTFIMGLYSVPITNGSALPSTAIASGMQMYPVDLAAFQFGSVDPTPPASPLTATNYFPTNFSTLQQFLISCNASNPIPNTSDGSCFAAVGRYCQSQGYEAGGMLEEVNNENAMVACVRSGNASYSVANISSVSAFQSRCSMSNLISDECATGMARYCQSIAYQAGGFGPLEYSDTSVALACMNNNVGGLVASTFQALSAQQPSCTATSWTSSMDCYSAVNRVCQSLGYISGYGVVAHVGNAATIGCIRSTASN